MAEPHRRVPELATGLNAAMRMSGDVPVPIGAPGSATGPTKVMPATACQVAKARWSAASKAPAP